MDRTKQKIEAIKRMKKLNLMDDVINLFDKEDRLYYSERQNQMFPAVLYWLDNEDNYIDLLKKFEKKTGGLVYHAVLTHTVFGDLLDFLYVSDTEDEWEMDNEDLNDGYAMVYSNNLDDEMCSEFGSIAVKPVMGGLERIS